MVFCIILGDNTETAFPVKLPSDKKVGELRELITKINPISFANIDAKDLILWQVSISDEDVKKMKILNTKPPSDINIEELEGKVMFSRKEIKFYFSEDPVDEHIHIIIIRPQLPATTVGPYQGIPRVTSIEDAMKKILKGIHKQMNVDNVDNNKSKSMALKQRDLKQAIDVIDRNFCNSLDKQETIKKETSIAKTNYRILLCGGAPGIGKTRYGVELFNCLDKEWKISKGQKPYMLYMLLDFSNSYALDEYEIQEDMKIASEIILGLRLAYYFFVKKKYVMSFAMFSTKANEYKHIFKLDNVLAHIYSHEHKRLQPGQHLFIFLQIDEFQLIFKDRKERAELFKQLMYVLGHHMTRKIPNIFIQTLLSGTAPQDAIRAMEPSMYSCEPLDLPLLSLESRLDIMREFATNHDVSDCVWMPKIWIHQLLLDTGGLPRALEYLFAELFGQKFTNIKEFFENLEKRITIPSTIYANVTNDINRAYKIKAYARNHKILIYELIYRNIMVIESDMSDELQDGNSTEKLEHLERDRHLILRKLEGKDKVLIDIPYFFMYLYADVLGIFTENLNKAFLPDSDWSWNNWKIFIADFIASHITMIDVLKKEKLLKLGDFFRSAQGSDITLGLLINFESVEIYELIHQFPCLNLSAKAGKTAMLKPGYIMINGYSAPFADVFFLVDNPEPILIAIQCRKRKKSLDLKIIEDEHKKNLNISEKIKEKAEKIREDAEVKGREMKEKLRNEAEQYTQLADFLSKYRIITIFITTQRFSEKLEDLPDDCILIHQENFDIFFGPVFSSRIKLVMTRDSNPNLSTASELMSRYKAISQNIGERIEKTRKRRIFRSHKEFCQEFPDLAEDDEIRNNFVYYPYPPHIEPFEHSNKRTRLK
ncbi:uncharacterized protein OCT59_007697 [Rhizophagus irregularis]|nr:hypothetical protein OCT59_007697 [Rhizophagus irregularis]GBC33571.2 hypothetical protein GLOIN_2v1729495 [Rhizophagus irregularis DAOM 181602=DAOM 197198]